MNSDYWIRITQNQNSQGEDRCLIRYTRNLMAKTLPTTELTLEHFLRSLVFRFRHATANAPQSFGDFEAAEGVRSPRKIVQHMSGLLGFTLSELVGDPRTRLEPLDWNGELSRFINIAKRLSNQLQTNVEVQGEVELDQLLRGPMIDTMTHIGQLALLRRLAGSPVEAVNYWKADMPALTIAKE